MDSEDRKSDFSDMDIDAFCEKLIVALRERVPAGTPVQIQLLTKANKNDLHALIIGATENTLRPALYIDGAYKALKDGTFTWEETVEGIYGLYQLGQENALSFDEEGLTDWNKAKDQIAYRLINRERNAGFLETVPYTPWLDLAIIFAYVVPAKGDTPGMVVVNTALKQTWGVGTQVLFAQAKKNTQRLLPLYFTFLSEQLSSVKEAEKIMQEPGFIDMPVITNRFRTYGSSAILYNGVLDKIHEAAHGSFYILPSSIHEVMILPAKEGMSIDGISKMVQGANSTSVPEKDFLSDHAYYYEAENGEIRY